MCKAFQLVSAWAAKLYDPLDMLLKKKFPLLRTSVTNLIQVKQWENIE